MIFHSFFAKIKIERKYTICAGVFMAVKDSQCWINIMYLLGKKNLKQGQGQNEKEKGHNLHS